MNLTILGNIEKRKPIQILGEESPPLEYWAELANTISYEILTSFRESIPRFLQEEENTP